MLAAAAGRPYRITYGGRCDFELADDMARMFIAAARAPFQGADIFNAPGTPANMDEVVAAIEAAMPEARGTITFEPKALPFPEELDGAPLDRVIGPQRRTPLAEGVAQTVAHFRQLLAEGRLDPDEGLK
jgi:UDP-glucuronate 4-epimerase